jgi:hypothetical protein
MGRNIRDRHQVVEKLRYIHRNQVKKELCERPEDWEGSSFRHNATGCEEIVEIESESTARKRERAAGHLCPAAHNSIQRGFQSPIQQRPQRKFTRMLSFRAKRSEVEESEARHPSRVLAGRGDGTQW